jgi:hypothetical protein
LFGPEFVPTHLLTNFVETLLSHRSLVFSAALLQNFELSCAFISQLIPLTPLSPANFSDFWACVITAIRLSESFQAQWRHAGPQSELNEFLSILMTLALEGIPAFRARAAATDFVSFLKEKLDNCRAEVIAGLSESLTVLIKTRLMNSTDFCNRANSVISQNARRKTISASFLSAVRLFNRSVFVMTTEYFLRERENLISKLFRMDLCDGDRLSISMLSDPLLPTRRVERSPLRYQVPNIGSEADLFPPPPEQQFEIGVFPTSCVNLLTYSVSGLPFLIKNSPHLLHAVFSPSLPVVAWQRLKLFEMLYGSFDFAASGEFLHGEEPIPCAIFVSGHNLVIGEGFSVSVNGLCPSHITQTDQEAFYVHHMVHGSFGTCTFFQGHPVVSLDLGELIWTDSHLWLHQPIGLALNFLRGFNFVLILSQPDCQKLSSLLKRFITDFMESAPPPTVSISPLASVRLLALPIKELSARWSTAEIDNLTYLSGLNRHAGSSPFSPGFLIAIELFRSVTSPNRWASSIPPVLSNLIKITSTWAISMEPIICI